VEAYVRERERAAADCRNDPLFRQIPVVSANRSFSLIKKLPTGKDDNADKKYEQAAAQLLASLLYPHLDFADEQSRTDSGVSIRDLIFYNNRSHSFLRDVFDEYGSRQLVFELKNVKAIEREHINQLNRYLGDSFGNFGVLVTRHDLPRAMMKNTIDLWSGKRCCIIALTDADLAQMVEIYESKQRAPIDVVNKKYAEFRRDCPS
jgi:DNA topoisomerase VI subunit A